MIWFTDDKPPTKVNRNRDERISNVLKRYDLTQAMLAEALGVSQPMVAQVATGERRMPPSWDLEAACERYTAKRDEDRKRMREALAALKARGAA